jgi:peptide/nickel transport system substrate-binding protein
MARDGKRFSLFALLLAFVLVVAACGDSEDDGSDGASDGDSGATSEDTEPPAPDEEGAQGGTLIWAHEQEPPDMHLDDPNNNLSITSWIRRGLIEGLYGVSSATEFVPELLAEEGEVVENDDGSVTINYVLRDDLQWSDGAPLTAADVEHTWNINVEGCALEDDGTIGDGEGCVYLRGDRTGYDLITAVTASSDTEFSVDMVSFFAGWKNLFDEIYNESFGATAEEVNENLREWQNADGMLPSSGPLIFDEWDRGVSMSFVRNDDYHGSVSPDARNDGVAYIDGLQINFVADTDAQINALKAGEAHIIYTQPQIAFGERLATDENFTVASTAGPVYEHWGFNMLNPHLAVPEVREAIAYALDKGEVMDGLYTPLFGDLLPAEGLGNVYWMSNQSAYEDHQTEYSGPKIDEAKAKLAEAGYAEGEDGIFAHPENGPLSLRVGTTGGNALRELQQELIQEQLKKAGIEIIINNTPGGDYFSEQPFSEEALAAALSGGAEGDPTIWDITQFAWVGGPWPGGSSASYRAGSENNPYGYASEAFNAKADECDATIDDNERAACYNELDSFVTTLEQGDDGLVVVPLTQKPSFYGYLSSELSGAGVAPDANHAGPLANVVDFQFKS